MERDRVLAVVGAGGQGSGYVLASRLVLTSAHVVAGDSASLRVFRPGRVGEFTARVLWCGTPGGRDDAALVLVDDPAWTPMPDTPLIWGRTVTYRPGIVCEAWGVAAAVQRNGGPVDTGHVTGTVNPGHRLVADRYSLELDMHPPEGGSPWAGMSGAAMFCEGLLAGVITVDPAARGHAALEAVPAYVLLADADFAAVVSEHAGADALHCETIELHALDEDASRVPVRSPAALLTARRAVVPFHGRADILTGLQEWAALPGVGVWLLHGTGGQGKTRLAHEFDQRLRRQGWATTWLAPTADADSLEVLAEVTARVLVVVDYAENRAGQLAALFTALARAASSASVKVLLLARSAGAWWEELTAAGGESVRDLAEVTRVSELPVLDATTAARDQAYRAAVSAFAAALSHVPGIAKQPWSTIAAGLPERPPAGSAGAGTVLAVQMTALADLLDAASTPPTAPLSFSNGARGPEDRVLDHERGYWKSTATAQGLLPGLSLATLTDVVIATALLGPGTVGELDAVLTRVPGMADQTADRRQAVRAWLTGLYPATADGTFEGLTPDRLAERLVGRSILHRGQVSVVESLAPTVRKHEAVRLLTVCARAAAHPIMGSGIGDTLTQWCVRHTGTLLIPAVNAAIQVEQPGPLVRAVEQVTTNTAGDVGMLQRLYYAFPDQSQLWAPTAAIVTQLVVDHRRQAVIDNPDHDPSDLANSLNNLSNHLGALGRREDALAAITEAVEVYRQLAQQRPDAFLPNLATSLNNLSNHLGDLGRREDALAAITEAVDIRRQLAQQRPEVHLNELEQSQRALAWLTEERPNPPTP